MKANKRLQICNSCPQLNTFKVCKLCKCFMPLKARIKSTTCPLNKWENCNGYDKKRISLVKSKSL